MLELEFWRELAQLYLWDGGSCLVPFTELVPEDSLSEGSNARELLVVELVLDVRGDGDPDASPDVAHQLRAQLPPHHLS